MDRYNQKFMEKAIQLAKENVKSGKGGPFGAIVVKDGQIIAEAMNEVTPSNDPTAHAEIVAIRQACRDLKTYQLEGCEMYSSCEPCPMCLGAIYWARPDRVYYAGTRKDAAASGFDDDFIYQEMELSPEKREIPFINIMRNEALEAFKDWDESELKIHY
ncbi:MAG: nucleoside deaminase [Bacteroidales bacterium]|nr:nucleoside deaminase [Bacteroidales bacterium]